MAAAMMMQIPMDMAPTRIASAMLCSCTISFHRWYGVSLSITRNAMMKISMPRKANASAAMILPSGTRFILFASGVVMIETVNGTIGAWIITNGLGNIFQLADPVEAPAAVLRKRGASENQHSVRKIKFSEHCLILRISDSNGGMITFRPAHPFKIHGAPGDGDSR